MRRGWILLWREVLMSDAWKNLTDRQKGVIPIILLWANYKENDWVFRGNTCRCKRGELITSLQNIADACNTTKDVVKGAIASLKKDSFLTTEPARFGTKISILNYDRFQPADGKIPTKEGTESARNTPPIKEYKEYKEKHSPNSVEFRLSVFLLEKILERHPNRKKPNLQNWATHMDYILRIDKRDPEHVQQIIEFSQQDGFWQDNILSTSKLRDKYDALDVKYQKSGYKRFVEEYTYNNPIWKKINEETKLTKDQIDRINEDTHKEKASRASGDKQPKRQRDKEKWEKKRAEILQKVSM